MTKRILITGSREWTDAAVIQAAIFDWVWENSPEPDEIILVHGDASRGADRIARDYARECDWLTEEAHRADWSWGSGAGHARNQEMVDLGADVCIGFIKGESRGTRGCLKKAGQVGIPIIIHYDDVDNVTDEA